ncbi:MAG TPA: AAA family ATPase [Candidatus Limnocylindrales bacterium]|nr:AAA family ATPase [Candidatus Limnocylindrales bacterium]
MDIVLPDPSVVVLIGPAGAGKSTFAARHFAADEVLSSDAFRAIVAGNEADQSATRAAFAALHRALVRRLAAGRLTVVDATNVERHARRAILARARVAGVPAVAIVFDLGLDLVLARNAGRRERVVEPTVVERHRAMLARLLAESGGETLAAEGFAAVHRLTTPDAIERVRFSRRNPPR